MGALARLKRKGPEWAATEIYFFLNPQLFNCCYQ
jgi:hypothetical protein